MRAKLLRCHLVVPASGAECSLGCQEVSLHLLFCRDGMSMEVPGSGAQRVSGCLTPALGCGITRKPPGCPTRSPARDFPLGLYVPCCGIWAGRAAGQRGEEMITATSYPCLPRAAGFISLIPILEFSLLFSLEGRDRLLKAGACCRECFHALGEQRGCPLAAPAWSRSVLLGAAGAAHEGTGTPPRRCPGSPWSKSGYTWGPLRCSGRTVFACLCKQPCQICKLSPAKAPRAPNCLFLLHPLRHRRAWPGPTSGQGIPAAADSMG